MKKSMVISSPLGNIRLVSEDDYLLACLFTEDHESNDSSSSFLLEVKDQLDAYFRGDLRIFDIQVGIGGTDFQKAVWMEINKIPFGSTATYQEIAKALGKPKSVRAVGMANRSNPLLIVIPCHRIIAQSGELRGYAGGLWRKLKLLQHESRDKPGNPYSLGF
ncbi:Methylated-DNA--protein-cysteine methyltransferase [Lunatimonas lonarensis]|uniref:Methylated-DNA--protein-cysteine methyltransferase n=1 Tax=Lunatimonas lonarensis TaxID=1232681 RepID=R7ZY29_9BACT|nr:methylated-DNA--[protein]-cysteine S-methyltransferase [Lunatimonas lonarensis]EON78972.1 Methylated-DNA--protein-cysteine methyltransferase [Lunatimonas lonarensis]